MYLVRLCFLQLNCVHKLDCKFSVHVCLPKHLGKGRRLGAGEEKRNIKRRERNEREWEKEAASVLIHTYEDQFDIQHGQFENFKKLNYSRGNK